MSYRHRLSPVLGGSLFLFETMFIKHGDDEEKENSKIVQNENSDDPVDIVLRRSRICAHQ